ncbi:CopG family transcriptional regulator [Nocardia crassostreae]|uniref:ribbon-helix-helix domain-containing protein n=1 Tax=Nocardia crassostreae TaxID=53428 RepID=UPI000833F13A|nr:CopG family transcriptional regulator [Nocardia crassostreae]
MKRTTVKLPDDMDDLLRHEAQRRGITVSELTREAISQYLCAAGGRRTFGAAGAGRSGRSDISSRIDEILSQEWGK